MKYDKMYMNLDKVEEIMESCLAAGVKPPEFEILMNMRFKFPVGCADWLFTIYFLRYWYVRSENGLEYWYLNELREEMIRRFNVPTEDLYEVPRRPHLWIV